jgi:hypothetical protein
VVNADTGEVISRTTQREGLITPRHAAINAVAEITGDYVLTDCEPRDARPTGDMSAERAEALSGTPDARAIHVIAIDYPGDWCVWERRDGVNWSRITSGHWTRYRAELFADAMAANSSRGVIYASIPDVYGPSDFAFFE